MVTLGQHSSFAMAGMWITRLGIKAHAPRHDPKEHHHEKSQPAMREDVWDVLPDDILERVVARLPLRSLVRMQAVSKKWKTKLQSARFIRQCELERERVVPTEWFLTFTATACFAYESRLSRWHSLPLGFLPCDITPRSPLAAADGLICLSSPTKVIICNPVSRFWRDVPLPPHLGLVSVAGLVVDRVAGAYKLVVVGEGSDSNKHLVAFLFDSASENWSAHEVKLDPLDSFAFLVARLMVCSVVCEGVLYCLTARPFQLHAFHVISQAWTRLRISLPAETSSPTLVARPGRLFLVGAYRHNQHDKSSNVGIWELDRDSQRWNVVDILLEAMCVRSRSPSRANAASNDVLLFVRWGARFLAYNVSKKSWVWLPTCIPNAAAPWPHHPNTFSFTPSLLLP